MTQATTDDSVQTYKPEPLVFTESAAKKVAELILEEENFNLKLRVFITGGGCSGFQYGFTFDEEQKDEDTVLEREVELSTNASNESTDQDEGYESGDEEDDEGGEGGAAVVLVKVLIDPMSFQYLIGAEIDYKEDLSGSQFVIRNPSAKTTCGCGSSFSI